MNSCITRAVFKFPILGLGIFAIVISVFTGAQAGWMFGKAMLAQHLLDFAWHKSLGVGNSGKPWPWADIRTVARLEIPAIDASLIVLNDASGEAMAFGPGLLAGNPLRAATETIALAGHRDTHLAWLEGIQVDTPVFLETADGLVHHYTIEDKQVVDTRKQSLTIASHSPGLVLVTCYPFKATQTGGPFRMIVTARPMSHASKQASNG